MSDHILVSGARENNLKDVTVRIPKRRIAVFTGVSGSGKSSLVFDTVAAEAQRQLDETFTTFVRNRLPKYGQPDVDVVENLNAAIIVDQKRVSGGSRSTVGTFTDIYSLLRLLYSRVAKPFVGYSHAFSFNDPQGMCPECEGLGKAVRLDLDRFLDSSRSLDEGALQHPDFAVGRWYWKLYAHSGLFDTAKKLADYTDKEWDALLNGADARVALQWQGGTVNSAYEGIVAKFTRLYIKKDAGEMSDRNRDIFLQFTTTVTCPLCHGARLSQQALAARIDGYSIADLAAMEATDLVEVLAGFTDPVAAPMVAGLLDRLRSLVTIGLGYLSLDRETMTLSGGEAQRIKMVRHLSSSLTEMLYVFDEPSVGLHPRDIHRLNELLVKLRDKGNSVLVVEHDPQVIEIADHVVDLGPGAGRHGGEVVYEGPVAGLRSAGTLTSRHLAHTLPLKKEYRTATDVMTIRDAALHNLRNVTVDVPVGVLTVVTGVAGSGKSTLINDVFVAQHPEAIVIDQTAVRASRRSNPATYTGILDEIRRLFARANDVGAGLFSSNSDGACPNCQGLGIIYTDLAYLDGLRSTCEVCGGRRFRPEVLAHKLRGQSISDVFDMTAGEALEFFTEAKPGCEPAGKKIQPILTALVDVGLEYLTLGQPLSTLSGGEAQRIKLATELHKSGTIYVMDEPTTGLHMSDIAHLLEVAERLVDRGNTVVVIEHNLDVIKNADWIVDLGPEGGSQGGRVLFTGTPCDLLAVEDSHTADYLRRNLAGQNS